MTDDNKQNPTQNESFIVSNVLRFHVPFISLNKLSQQHADKRGWTRKLDVEEKVLVFAVAFVAVILIFSLL